MKYVLLLHLDEGTPPPDPLAVQAEMRAYAGYKAELESRGTYLAGEALHPSSTTTTVRVREDGILTTDGPFAESAEQVAGFYLVECEDLDEALRVAAGIPGARHGSVEVRPVWEYAAEIEPARFEGSGS
jgi:hypothetical protein